ncbi:MAG: ATP-binding cassette domain-containing protein, partial [Planctomycetaceae bacterium]|nr:ATP-binding cassette domain-containing protein [Planctomycetaceae bacterium]
MTPLLETHQLCRQADDGTLLIEDLSVAFPAGSRTAIMGAPGSGKTLLLRLLAFLDPITSGEIRLRGNLVPDHGIPRARRQVQLISQKPVLIEGTVRENLRLPYSFRGNRDRMFDEAWH